MERREVGEKERGRFSPPWLDSVAAKNRSSVRRSWFIAKDRWLARRNKELRAFHDGLLANTMPPVRAEFSQPSHLATRAPDTNRGCARADTGGGGGRGRERGEEAGHVCIHTRASGVQVIRAISSKFRSNEISRVVVPLSPSLPLSLSLFVPSRLYGVHKLGAHARSPRWKLASSFPNGISYGLYLSRARVTGPTNTTSVSVLNAIRSYTPRYYVFSFLPFLELYFAYAWNDSYIARNIVRIALSLLFRAFHWPRLPTKPCLRDIQQMRNFARF